MIVFMGSASPRVAIQRVGASSEWPGPVLGRIFPCRPVFLPLASRPARKGRPQNRGVGSPVARQAHNLKVTGSNPVPVTNEGPEV